MVRQTRGAAQASANARSDTEDAFDNRRLISQEIIAIVIVGVALAALMLVTTANMVEEGRAARAAWQAERQQRRNEWERETRQLRDEARSAREALQREIRRLRVSTAAGIQTKALTLHSDCGAPMTSKCTAQLLADLGVTRSLSRPQVSDDNPFSEAQFKTLKYHPGFPGRFADLTAATAFCRSFFPWYNTEHRYGGIAMLTPDDVHHGRAPRILEQRLRILRLA